MSREDFYGEVPGPGPMAADSPPDPTEGSTAVAGVVAGLTEMLAPVLEATTGLRARLISEGWSPESAEVLALRVYDSVMDALATVLNSGSRRA